MLPSFGVFRANACRGAAGRPFRRLLAPALLLFAFLLPITVLRAQDNVTQRPKDSDAIVAHGIIRVAITEFDLPAFHWRKPNGELTGPEIELTRLIGRLLKVGVEFVDDCHTFDAVVDAVASGRADIGISKLSQTPAGFCMSVFPTRVSRCATRCFSTVSSSAKRLSADRLKRYCARSAAPSAW